MKKGRRDWRWAHSPGTTGNGARWISIHEAAALLSISESGCRKLIDRSIIPVARLGRMIRVDVKGLNEQLEGQTRIPERRSRG